MCKKIIGFTAGAFDMFHIGHLNLLKNARARCDYLIVGVNSDALVNSYKGAKVIIPLEERIDIIKSLRYADEVIALDSLDKENVWRDRKFDVVFIGDDWKGSPRWNQTETVLKKHGVEVLYLPYTRGRTSTLLREKLRDI